MFAPSSDFLIVFNLNKDLVRVATDWTVFEILLPGALRQIDWNDNLLTARIANIKSFIIHLLAFGFGELEKQVKTTMLDPRLFIPLAF